MYYTAWDAVPYYGRSNAHGAKDMEEGRKEQIADGRAVILRTWTTGQRGNLEAYKTNPPRIERTYLHHEALPKNYT